MPLGDSITMGRHGEPAGYRDDLSMLLLNDGADFIMVGSLNDGSGFYPFHEGHSGWLAGEIDDYVDHWLALNPADIVLLHIGTNDISDNVPLTMTIQDIDNILDKIFSKNSQTKILLCSLIPRWEYWIDRPLRTDQLNAKIYALYTEKLTLGYNIYFVDQAEAFYANEKWQQEYMDDYVHPNDTGYHIMAETFHNVLLPLLAPALRLYSITGHVLYYANNNPISEAEMTISGSSNFWQMTDATGYYAFDNLTENLSYFIRPAKTAIDRSENSIITMYDAALTLRHAVGIAALVGNSSLAADVDRNGQIYAYDAALIARYVVELPRLSGDQVGQWIFTPESRTYQHLGNHENGQDFVGILLGDVHGGWNKVSAQQTFKILQYWPATIETAPEEIISLPISLIEDSLLSLYLELELPSSLLEFQQIKTESLLESFQLLYSLKENILKLGLYAPTAETIEGTILTINFKIKPKVFGRDFLCLRKMQVNNYFLANEVTTIYVAPAKTNVGLFQVAQNYPNPFNPATTISYHISESSRVTIRVFNMNGALIKTLLEEEQKLGTYEVVWDGRNEEGRQVGSGIYLYKVTCGDKSIGNKMTKIE